MHEKTFVTTSAEETQALGEQLGKRISGGVIALYGDLGSGKTTFVQGLAKGLGITRRIMSPTFVIVRSYRTTNYEPRTTNFYHIDLYRVQSIRDLEGLGLEEILEDPDNIVAIEWPDRLSGRLPKDTIAIHFTYKDSRRRKITISSSVGL